MTNNQIQELPVDLIDDPVNAMRQGMDPDSLRDLSTSIKSVGLIQPITVRKNGTRYEVISGHRRLAACRQAGLAGINCIVVDADDEKADVLKIHENLYREDVNIIDEATFLAEMILKKGYNITEMSHLIRRSETYVRDRLDLLKWDREMMEAVGSGKISFSAAKHLSRITDEKVRHQYLNFAVKGGISPRVAFDWYSRWKNGQLPPTPSEKILHNFETDKEEVIQTVPCELCGGDCPVAEARLFYAHPECLRRFQNIALEANKRIPAESPQG